MQSKVRLLGHPVHPMIVPFPIAFFTATLLCAIVYASTQNVFWFKVEFIANCAGFVMAVVAVLPGLIDWISIPMQHAAKATGMKHMIANGFSVGFFGANAAVNYSYFNAAHPPMQSGVLLCSFGFLIMLYAGFKGWKMVQTHHVGIDKMSSDEIPEQNAIEKNASEVFTDTTESPEEKNNICYKFYPL